MADEQELIEALRYLLAAPNSVRKHSMTLFQEDWESLIACTCETVADARAPKTLDDVRAWDDGIKEIAAAGVFSVLSSVDTTVELGEEDGFCVDWHIDQLIDNNLAPIALADREINTPMELMEFVEKAQVSVQ